MARKVAPHDNTSPAADARTGATSRKPRDKAPVSRRVRPQPLPTKSLKEATVLLFEGLAEPLDDAYELARETIRRVVITAHSPEVSAPDGILFPLSCSLSASYLPGYATLDSQHIREIDVLTTNIQRYVEDASTKRPLNLLMLASPGAGKSFFIKCLASKLGSQNIGAITFNMAGLQTNEDLIPALDAARNMKVEDKIPLLFLDEFDSKPGNYALLLPLLWDGELNLGQRDLKLGKVVIVLAGSDPALPETMDNARSMRQEEPRRDDRNPKLVDLLSRINGGTLPIPPFYDLAHQIDRRPDKVCIAVELLRQRFGPTLRTVPLALLKFIALTEFRYGVRSIAHLIDSIPHQKDITDLRLNDLSLPINDPKELKASSLAFHFLHEDQAHGVVNLWKEARRADTALPVWSEVLELQRAGLPAHLLQFVLDDVLERALSESPTQPEKPGGK